MKNFVFSERHIEEYTIQGATIFRGILPPSLVGDLRRATARVHEIARDKHGPQTQRLQPIIESGIEMKPFEDYRDLPALHDAIAKVVSPQHRHGNLDMIGLLLEPADLPYCTAWHRDAREILSADVYAEMMQDTDLANQINCALYDDGSTWIVPGSDRRPDTPDEAQMQPIHPAKPNLDGMSAEERERYCLHYAQRMPGARQLYLHAGDFALYRACMWHLGNYVPYCKRVTIHEGAFSPKVRDWWNANIAPAFLPRVAPASTARA